MILALLLAAATSNPAQIKVNKGATGSVSQTLAQFYDTTPVTPQMFGAKGDGTTDDTAAVTSAIAALPSTGGTIWFPDANYKLGSTLTISKSGTTLRLGAGTITLGANQIVVTAGVHNVSLAGAAPYGSATNGVAGPVAGTSIVYTGTTVAIKVGDSTADTYGFRMRDVALNLEAAGTSAIGVQLNRAPQYVIGSVRFSGFSGANTNIAFDLEGYTSFTGGKIEDPYILNATGVYFGKNANANWIVGGIVLNNNAGHTCYQIAGDATGTASGNMIFGSDCEAATGTGISIDYGQRNQIFGMRAEQVTTYISASANSSGNMILGAPTSATITDNGVNTVEPNSFVGMRQMQFTPTTWKLYNREDLDSELDLYSGATTGHITDLNLKKYDNTRGWTIRKAANDNLFVLENSGNTRVEVDQGGQLVLNAGSGANAVFFNSQASSGTSGVRFYSGGATPSLSSLIQANGDFQHIGRNFASLGTPSNGTLTYCTDCTIANPCAGGGTGAFAKRLNGAWICN